MAQVAEDGEMDLNLIPLLDLVLQLMMFFIIVANFAEQEVTTDVKLPFAKSATLPEKDVTDLLYVNIDYDGGIIVTGREAPLHGTSEMEYYLKTEAQHALEAAQSKGDKSGVLNTIVVIRAHRDCDFKPIYEVLRVCKSVGFRKWQLRAIMQNQAGG
jgi:biopolymer transport protein ExbD